MAFAMGRTLVLPPEQGMYLLNKDKGKNNLFSFDHFFHMESISKEHVGLNIISTKEFLELCAKGKIVDQQNQPIVPPANRTDYDGADFGDLKTLKTWLRDHSGQNLLHWDPDRCVAAFPASSSREDSEALAALHEKQGAFRNYQKFIGKPHDVDAPAQPHGLFPEYFVNGQARRQSKNNWQRFWIMP